MNMAMGMVAATVKTPQGLSASALTTTRASTASSTIMMAKIARVPTLPAMALISSRTIWARDFPSRRSEAARMTKS